MLGEPKATTPIERQGVVDFRGLRASSESLLLPDRRIARRSKLRHDGSPIGHQYRLALPNQAYIFIELVLQLTNSHTLHTHDVATCGHIVNLAHFVVRKKADRLSAEHGARTNTCKDNPLP